MKTYTTLFAPDSSLTTVATEESAALTFTLFLHRASQRGWQFAQVTEIAGGLLFVLERQVGAFDGAPPPSYRS
jgi:hypothetical protein